MIGLQLAVAFPEFVVRSAAQQVDAAPQVADGDHEGRGVGGIVEADQGIISRQPESSTAAA